MIKKLFSILCLIALPLLQLASSSDIENRQYNEEKMELYQANQNFDYSTEVAQRSNILKSLFSWILEKINWVFQTNASPESGWNWLKILMLAILIGAVVLVLKMRFGRVISSEGNVNQPIYVNFNNEEGTDFSKLLVEAIEAKDLKLSVRYLYHTCLSKLHTQNKIKLSIWKTAMDYLNEVPDEYGVPFEKVTRLFQKTWYGDISPDEEEFENALKLAKETNLA